jgi:hypothetical protein
VFHIYRFRDGLAELLPRLLDLLVQCLGLVVFNAGEEFLEDRRIHEDHSLINKVRVLLTHLSQSPGLGLVLGWLAVALRLGGILAVLGGFGGPWFQRGASADAFRLSDRWFGPGVISPHVPGEEVKAALVFICRWCSLHGVAMVAALEAALLLVYIPCVDDLPFEAAVERREKHDGRWEVAAVGAAVRGDGLQDADLVAGGPRTLEQPLGRLRLGRMRRRRLPLLLLGRRLRALGRQHRQRPRRLLAAGRRGRHGETFGGKRGGLRAGSLGFFFFFSTSTVAAASL